MKSLQEQKWIKDELLDRNSLTFYSVDGPAISSFLVTATAYLSKAFSDSVAHTNSSPIKADAFSLLTRQPLL